MHISITGMGVVSALGVGKAQNLEALRAGRSGIAPIRYLKTEHQEFPVGEVPLANDTMETLLGIAPDTPTTRSSLMGMLALDEALREAGLTSEQLPTVAFISATTVGGMDKSEQFYANFLHDNTRDQYIETHDCGACTHMIADHFGSFAMATTLSTACSSAANAVVFGANLLRSGRFECVVVGGTECITKFHLNGFNSLMILDHEPCRPFSPDRAGLNLGEGAAYLVLETLPHALKRGATPLAFLSGYGNACDAFHQTASSPEGVGAYLAMTQALAMAGLTSVDYINAHGTGTPNNDDSESQAIGRLFHPHVPPVSSTKSMTGHTTSASGAIESVFSVLALQHQFLPAKQQSPDTAPLLLGALTAPCPAANLSTVMCNSFGFGGNDTSLLFSLRPMDDGQMSMADTPVFLRAVESISLQNPLTDDWLVNPVIPDQEFHTAVDPDFKPFVPPMEARRMTPLLKRAVAVSKSAIAEAGDISPEALITGTGLGCVLSTEKFLTALTFEGEQTLKPTHFMQSTHNTIGSTLAIHTHNHGYNTTYAHGQTSFDSALLDGFIQISNGQVRSALVGSHDELTPAYFQFLKKTGFLGHDGIVAGEASVAAYLSTDPDHALCRVFQCHQAYRPSLSQLQTLLETWRLHTDTLAVMTGVNGSAQTDQPYLDLCDAILPQVPLLRYKHLFGEGYSASALAFYVAAHCLSRQMLPPHLLLRGVPPTKLTQVLILNYSPTSDCSLILLETVGNE